MPPKKGKKGKKKDTEPHVSLLPHVNADVGGDGLPPSEISGGGSVTNTEETAAPMEPGSTPAATENDGAISSAGGGPTPIQEDEFESSSIPPPPPPPPPTFDTDHATTEDIWDAYGVLRHVQPVGFVKSQGDPISTLRSRYGNEYLAPGIRQYVPPSATLTDAFLGGFQEPMSNAQRARSYLPPPKPTQGLPKPKPKSYMFGAQSTAMAEGAPVLGGSHAE